MSALGQKQTYALQQAMSALPPIATAKGDTAPQNGHVRFTPESAQNSGRSISLKHFRDRLNRI
jgi:hypothetical protein